MNPEDLTAALWMSGIALALSSLSLVFSLAGFFMATHAL